MEIRRWSEETCLLSVSAPPLKISRFQLRSELFAPPARVLIQVVMSFTIPIYQASDIMHSSEHTLYLRFR